MTTVLRLLCAVSIILGTNVISAFAAPPEVSVLLLDGTSRKGALVSISLEGIEISQAETTEKLIGESLMTVDFPPVTGASTDNVPFTMTLADQTVLQLKEVESDGTLFTFSTSQIEKATASVRQVSSLRLATLDDKVSSSWEDLRSRNARDDLMVIRKGDVLDYVAGSIGKMTPTTITIIVRERELSAPREKVFGLIFASRSAPPPARRVTVRSHTGDQWLAESLSLEGEAVQITTASVGKQSIPLSSLQSIDFGGGRIRFLADLPFDQSASKPPHENDPVVWFTCRNAPSGSGGKLPLTIGTQEYRKGLWMHSGAVVRFRLNREFTQLKATAGFELSHVSRMPRFDPRVKLVILGDNSELYAKEFGWNDAPEKLVLDLKDVRELTIRVESMGAAQGILEHFALGDAQVIQ
ncbi:NPCBM/NEW2 domain-containing protein [Planctomicrobium sp. SH668]|uniref:NPCBM/NEW2 domain-containing protein n=1 Tax=Planctomicrobium sp. SH668 TaxID=3448126 RepID=UPI003F5BFFEB